MPPLFVLYAGAPTVVPAEAGTHTELGRSRSAWVPACAGTTPTNRCVRGESANIPFFETWHSGHVYCKDSIFSVHDRLVSVIKRCRFYKKPLIRDQRQ
jgi:hypothetical protein